MIDQLNSIISRFQNLVEFGACDLKNKVQYDNARFTQPDGIWVRLAVLTSETLQWELGSEATERTEGIAIASIFIPWEKALKNANEIAIEIRSHFNRISVDGVTYRTPSAPQNLGRVDEFFQVNVSIPFFIDEVVVI